MSEQHSPTLAAAAQAVHEAFHQMMGGESPSGEPYNAGDADVAYAAISAAGAVVSVALNEKAAYAYSLSEDYDTRNRTHWSGAASAYQNSREIVQRMMK